MAKVIGAMFTIWGTLLTLFNTFLYLNSPAFINYNGRFDWILQDTGLVLPLIGGLFLLTVGIIFLSKSSVPERKIDLTGGRHHH